MNTANSNPVPSTALVAGARRNAPAARAAVALWVAVTLTTPGQSRGVEESPPVGVPNSLYAANIPQRPAGAPTGSEFGRLTRDLSARERQRRAIDELRGGNLPGFLRELRPVQLTAEPEPGKTLRAVIWVMPDYLAIGSDDDFLRMPLALGSATAVARALGFTLPTTRMVDAIYAQADHRLTPEPMPPGPLMRSVQYFLGHRRRIENQRAGLPLGALIAGHKKDVVLTNQLLTRPDRIAIYGWHRGEGEPIQPLSTVHGSRYADYSHGVRLVLDTVWIDAQPRSIYEVLADPTLAPLLSDEGPLPRAAELMGR